MILGLETATDVCAAATASGGRVVAESSAEERHIHAERLMAMVDEVLARSGCSVRECEAIAISIGPGSFTGLRIGLSVAKGLAFSAGKPIVPVPTLRAIAEQTARRDRDHAVPAILPLLDARKDEVYAALFAREGSGLRTVWEERDWPLAALAEQVAGMQVLVTGQAAPRLRAALGPAVIHQRPGVAFASTEEARSSAGIVALLGEELLAGGGAADPRTLEPRYIKEFFLRTKT
jgi:tRNA threonylcarbamoyladenosine biosynthesis protein TsaB